MFTVIDSYIALTAVAAIAVTVLGIAAERRNARSPQAPGKHPEAPAFHRAA